MKNVLIITYYWPPSGGAGVQRWLKFVKYIYGSDINPIVLTVDPKVASYPVQDESLMSYIQEGLEVFTTNTFEPFEIYKVISGRKIIPYGGFANEKKESFFWKVSQFIRGNLFIPDARKGWNRFAIKKAEELIKKREILAIITTSPPHSTQLIGLFLKKKFNLPWIADLRDPWTDIYYYDKLKHTSIAKKIDAAYEREVLERADKVVVVSDFIKQLFLNKSNKLNSDKFQTIPNGFDEVDFKDFDQVDKQDKFIITYTGTITSEYQPHVFVNALKKVIVLRKDVPIVFRFVGSLPYDVKEYFYTSFSKKSFEFTSYVSHDKIIKYLYDTSILYHAIPEVKNNEGIITGKLFEYLASRKPIVCIGTKSGDAARIIKECEAGKVFEKEDGDEIVNYLLGLIDEWRDCGFLQNKNTNYLKYSRQNSAGSMKAIIDVIV